MKKRFAVYLVLLFSFAVGHAWFPANEYAMNPTNDDMMNWNAPVTISGALASDPQIVMDSNGNATASWIQNGAMCVSTQPVGGSWSSVTTLASSSSSAPQLAVDSSGNVTAAWIQSGVVKTAVLPFGGSWSSVTTVSSSTATSLVLAVNPSGGTVLAWLRSGVIEASTKQTLLGLLSLVSTLSGSSAANPALYINGSGAICAVWERTVSGSNVIQAATQTLGGSWGSVQTITAATGFNYGFPQVAVNPSGNPTAIFYQYATIGSEYINVAPCVSTLSGGSWSTPETLLNVNTPGYGVINPANLMSTVQFDTAGNAMALWTQCYDGSNYSIEGALNPVNGTGWTVGDPLITTNIAFQTGIAMTSLTEAIIAYMYFDGTYATIHSNETGTSGLHTGQEWAVDWEISTPGTNNGYPSIASVYDSSTGLMYATAVWLNSSGGNVYVQAATGSKTPIQPPTSLSVTQSANNFGVFTQYYNTISWTATVSPEVNYYAVYRNEFFFELVPGNITQAVDENVVNGGSVTYGVTAVDGAYLESVIIDVNYP